MNATFMQSKANELTTMGELQFTIHALNMASAEYRDRGEDGPANECDRLVIKYASYIREAVRESLRASTADYEENRSQSLRTATITE